MNKEKCNFLIGIVLYNENISSASTVVSLMSIADFLNSENAKLIIWDNSPTIQSEKNLKALSKFSNVDYFHTPENLSLSKIYNRMYLGNQEFTHLILFDQDSRPDQNYFEKMLKAILDNVEINLFLPIIKVKDLIVSPADRFIINGKYWKKEYIGLVNAKKRLAITSGMAINLNYLLDNNPAFDENLTLYGIDTDFMIQYEKVNTFFYVVNYVMEHDLSFFSNELIQKKALRYKNQREALLTIALKESYPKYVIANFIMIFSTLRLSWKYKSNKFI
tara:strand:+ start:64754 stop:65581 length:828 start_codon:yes stop_codon:yes gene_type:complete